MKNIVYFSPNDIEKFDFERFKNSINTFTAVPEEEIKKALEKVDNYETMHVSLLVKIGVALIEQFGSEEKAREYYEKNQKYFGEKFERLRRITGYLVGTLDRWNDGKKAEEKVRVKHSVNSCVDDLVRAAKIQDQILAMNAAYAGKTE